MVEVSPVKLLVLDLDGTVRKGVDDEPGGRFVNRPEDVEVFPEARVLMRRWRAEGGRIVGATNQGGIALGFADEAEVRAAIVETNRQTGWLFDDIRFCPHHPDAPHHLLAVCWCRKPQPGMIIEAAAELRSRHPEFYPPSYGMMVGDRPEDEAAAAACGLDFMWAHEWRATA